jgi:hypothetical protein
MRGAGFFLDRINGISGLTGFLDNAVEGGVEDLEGFGGVRFGEVHGGEPADDFGAGGDDEEAVFDELGGEPDGGGFAGGLDGGEGIELGFVEFEADHHAEGADVRDEGVFPGGDFAGDALAEGGGEGGEVVAFDDTEGGEAGGAGEGAAAVGGAVSAGSEEVDQIADGGLRIADESEFEWVE